MYADINKVAVGIITAWLTECTKSHDPPSV